MRRGRKRREEVRALHLASPEFQHSCWKKSGVFFKQSKDWNGRLGIHILITFRLVLQPIGKGKLGFVKECFLVMKDFVMNTGN